MGASLSSSPAASARRLSIGRSSPRSSRISWIGMRDMKAGFAEVIGDPVAHSKSPLIHKAWLQRLGLPGDYRASRVSAAALAGFLEARRADPDWRGCNVTIPHKLAALSLADTVDPAAKAIG